MQKYPLKGIRVVDVTTFLAAPQCGRMLAAMGADVIKVEAPGKDFFRIESPLFEVGIPCSDQENPIFLNANAGKRFIAIDMTTEKGGEVFKRLIAGADMMITNMRTGALKKLGIDYDSMKVVNPGLVYGHVDGYGQLGEDAPKPGFDTQAYYARGGYLLDLNETGDTPNEMVLGAGDSATSLALLTGILGALIGSRRTGKGRFVNASLLHTAVWGAGMRLLMSQYGVGSSCARTAQQALPHSNVYRCKDGEWIVLSAGKDVMGDWKKLCNAIGPELAEDERFSSIEAQHTNIEAAVELLDARFAEKTFAQWDEILSETGLMYERAARLLEVIKDEQTTANECFIKRDYPSGKTVYYARPPFRLEDAAVEDLDKTIHFCEHTDEILMELDYNPEQIAALRACGAVR